MKIHFTPLACIILLAPYAAISQVTPPVKDTVAHVVKTDSLAVKTDTLPKVDSTNLIMATPAVPTAAVKVSCYAEWQDAFRTRGAKPVTDGMQQVVIGLKDSNTCHCFMGKIEVVGGKIKPPLYFQQENGEYRLVSVVGKKIEAAFAGSMTTEELYTIKDGMSIVFRTTDNEYGRLFFYKFVNKNAQSNKEALSPSELIKE
ncbi:MAG: hypothetical protein ACJ749_02505 [Flavisolibacter sp.]